VLRKRCGDRCGVAASVAALILTYFLNVLPQLTLRFVFRVSKPPGIEKTVHCIF
jgi:hypothetical protein